MPTRFCSEGIRSRTTTATNHDDVTWQAAEVACDLGAMTNSMSEYEFAISLRIRHPSIEPDEITRTLGIEPQHTWKAGDRRRSPAGDTLEGSYRESYWMGRLMDEPQVSSDQVSVESVLLQILAQLRRSLSFLAALNAEGGVAELDISIFARGDFRLELLSESLALLGRLGLGAALEVHPLPQTPA